MASVGMGDAKRARPVRNGAASSLPATGSGRWRRLQSLLAFGAVLLGLAASVALPIAGGSDELVVTLSGGVSLALLRVPSGAFLMGSPESERGRVAIEVQHLVTITQDYYFGKSEITQAQWRAVMGTEPAGEYGSGPNLPVYFVSWSDVAAAGGFIEKLNAYLQATGQPGAGLFRLPSEAEWERAARAGSQTRFSFGDALDCDDQCSPCAVAVANLWYCANNPSQGPSEVAQKPANGFGLFDMHGNVWEWVNDFYGPYSGAPAVDPTGPASGDLHVRRGGGWDESLIAARAANRGGCSCDTRSPFFGFRVARSVEGGPRADFTWSPPSPHAGEPVSFADASSGSPGTWVWSLGDGATTAEQSPAHRYFLPGAYHVTLTVQAAAGSSTMTKSVEVAPFPNVRPRLRRRLLTSPQAHARR